MASDNKRKSMVGMRFGDWVVLQDLGGGNCLCRCSCGNIKEVNSSSLRQGKSTSCGHNKRKTPDLTHQLFGEWYVEEYVGNGYYRCRCSCGTVKNVKKAHLLNGTSKSCGHNTTKFNDLTGKVFGDWYVIEYKGNRKYSCRCSCGTVKDVDGYSLIAGTSTNCGCKNQVNFDWRVFVLGITFNLLTPEQQNKALSLMEVPINKLRDDPRRLNLTDMKFGDWTVIGYAGHKKWVCICSCGEIRSILGTELRSGRSTSCGHERKAADLVGKTFGYWEVIEKIDGRHHRCRCHCGCGGTEKSVLTYDLISGKTKSCGRNTTRKDSIIGKKFNHWTVLARAKDGRYKCECDCEYHTIGYVTRTDLITGKSKSCGHDTNRLVDITGQTFGNWYVIKHVGYGRWLCKCLCELGTEKELSHTDLINGNTKSCGCKHKEVLKETMLNKYGETAACKIDNPRTPEQIAMVENADNLRNIILNNFDHKPTIYELENILGLNYSRIIKIIHQYNLEDYTTIYENVSHLEREVLEVIKGIIPEELIETGNRSILDGKELDIYIPSKKLAIEFNGSYWHSHLFKDKKYHQQKTIDCARKGVRLIQIFEYEWVNDTTRIKIEEMLRRILAPEQNKIIYARKTKVVNLEYSEVKEFLNNNHLQGTVISSINYGLLYNNEIIAVMTFGKPRFSKDNSLEYELLRLAFKNGTVVIGGSEKLFNAFIKDYNPNNIISYCDIAKFNGGVYGRLGFKTTQSDMTQPNYVWIDKRNNVLPRYRTMKHKLLEKGLGTPDMTENEIMENLGYFKVYDCGNLRFIWNKEED